MNINDAAIKTKKKKKNETKAKNHRRDVGGGEFKKKRLKGLKELSESKFSGELSSRSS